MPILEIQFVVLKIGQLLRAMLVEARSLKRPCTLLQCLASKHVHRETVSRIERTRHHSKKSKHEMLHIVFSRVKRRSSFKVLLLPENHVTSVMFCGKKC
ncbi:hypothetical protein V1478_008724 [Vespula squamosa]|uniref:Secreted protein n=1 Tax=Vespula squamosa TaxID=30214 RepID=A0ABD2AUD0_VESSQ